MLIYAIDDDPGMLEALCRAIGEAAPGAAVVAFDRAEAALARGGAAPDFVFTDIHLPGLDGLELAARMKRRHPAAKVVFVTAHPEHALDAWMARGDGFIVKPVTAARVRQELDYHAPAASGQPEKLEVHCFGRFEVLWRGAPLMFGRRQTKELLAYLIDRKGTVCAAEEIAATLWEDETNIGVMKTRLRQLISDLRVTLEGIGLGDMVIRRRGLLGLRLERVDCDYYRMLDGDPDAVNAFRGEYMSQYGWANFSEGNVNFWRQ